MDVGARLRCARLGWGRPAGSSLRPKTTRQKSQKSHCRTPTQIFGPQLRSPARHASRYRHQGMPGRPTPRGRQAARVGEVHSTPNPVVVAFRGRASRSLLLQSLACQSGLRRCRHASTTSADLCHAAVRLHVSSRTPARSRRLLCCCTRGRPPRTTVAESSTRALFDTQRLQRLHKRAAAAADADSGTRAGWCREG